MKKLAAIVASFIVVVVAIGFNLSRASQEPLITTPDPLQVGRDKLHAQLMQSEQREAAIEKQDWNSIPLLRELVVAHQTRIQKLTGNGAAVEIIAHDQDAIARLQKRIQDLTAIESEKPAVEKGKGE